MFRFTLAGALAMALLAAGPSRNAPASRAPADAAADNPVLAWNVAALRTTAAAPFDPPMESRNVAIVHAAMHDAVNAIVREFEPYAVEVRAPEGASPEAAAAAAAHLALVRLYPGQRADLDAALATSLAAIPDGADRDAGVEVGEEVASRILALRANDGAGAAIAARHAAGERPGEWRPTPPDSRPALDPGWGTVRPFLIESGSRFRPGPPPALDSPAYARDLDEIRGIGSATSATRTRAQADLARFWIATGPQNWNPAARQAARTRGLTLSQTARALALLNLAGADAFIACWDAKFAYGQWRPVTAFRAAGDDADPAWTPLLVTPPFPDYPAGHTTYAGAAEEVLDHVFGRNPGVTMTLTSPTAPGVVKTFTTFGQISDGVVDARVWGGIHWRTSCTRGRELGRLVGRWAVDHHLKPNRATTQEAGSSSPWADQELALGFPSLPARAASRAARNVGGSTAGNR